MQGRKQGNLTCIQTNPGCFILFFKIHDKQCFTVEFPLSGLEQEIPILCLAAPTNRHVCRFPFHRHCRHLLSFAHAPLFVIG